MGEVIEGQFGEEASVTEEPTETVEPPPQSTALATTANQVLEKRGVNPLIVAGIIIGTTAAFALGLYGLSVYQKHEQRESRSRRKATLGEMHAKAKKAATKKRRPKRSKPLRAAGPVDDFEDVSDDE